MVEVRRTARRTALRAAAASSAAPLLAACIGSPRPDTPATTSPAPGGSTLAAAPRPASPAASSPASGTGSVSWSETATGIAVANQYVRLRLTKATGAVDSLQLDGQELLGNGGSAYFDLDGSRVGHFTLGRDDRETT